MANIVTGGELVGALAKELNGICKNEGGILRDDSRIWDILHKMNEQEWDDLITTLEVLLDYDPSCFNPNDTESIINARVDFNKSVALGKDFVGKPMVSKSGNKRTVWKLIMALREVVNRHNNVYVTNNPALAEKRKLQETQPDNFKALFA